MKNQVETEGKSCKWKYMRGERSCQNTVELFIFVLLLSCAYLKQQF